MIFNQAVKSGIHFGICDAVARFTFASISNTHRSRLVGNSIKLPNVIIGADVYMVDQTQLHSYLDKFSSSSNQPRVHKHSIDDQVFWFKLFNWRNITLGRVFHRGITPLLRKPYLKAAPLYISDKALQKECEKAKVFQEAGLQTPEIVLTYRNFMITKDAGPTLVSELIKMREKDQFVEHDQLLCEWAAQIGKIHAAGLSHGRPETRDTIFKDGKWIFFDFEEFPEEVMPLKFAQARDLFLIFHILSRDMHDKSKLDDAMSAYRKFGPDEAYDALRSALEDVKFINSLIFKIPPKIRGRDLRQSIGSIEFLARHMGIT